MILYRDLLLRVKWVQICNQNLCSHRMCLAQQTSCQWSYMSSEKQERNGRKISTMLGCKKCPCGGAENPQCRNAGPLRCKWQFEIYCCRKTRHFWPLNETKDGEHGNIKYFSKLYESCLRTSEIAFILFRTKNLESFDHFYFPTNVDRNIGEIACKTPKFGL